MFNDPELNGRYLGTITRDFARVADYLKEASYQIRSRGLSKYPVFVVCKTVTPLGVLLLDRHELQLDWNYAASYLGEFVDRQLVDKDKQDDFIAAYKNPDEFCCLFVVDEEFTNFVFVPFPED